MAIVFSKNSGLNDEAWKTIDTTLRMVMQDTDTAKNNDDEIVKQLFNVAKSKKFGEKQGSMTEFGNFKAVDEGDVAIADDVQMGFSKLIEHKSYIKGFTVTRESRDDGDIDMSTRAAANFVRSYKRSRHQFATNCLTTEGSTFTYEGRTYDKTTGDGKALFAVDHPYKKSTISGTQSNVFTNAFGTDTTMLNRLAVLGRGYKNQSGNIMGYTFDTIIIPGNVPDLEDLIKRIIRSDLIVGSDFNDVNTQKGLWKLVVDPYWIVPQGQKPYILQSSDANKEMNGSAFWDRVPLDVKNNENIGTRNLEYSGYCRFSSGFYGWYHVIMGGAQAGSVLT